ncbi:MULTISPECIES: glycosyltransferase family 4 protein [unclassified Microcoleus]|uniref:glycosyltransferase family 4 protein n=1 Tax=unclassified Microcoleus TaxID=2642155 RepID=UPI001E105E3C|nr:MULTISPECIES: glycosyltransferase family 4 protein [unclassified Microcoleus]MCC3502679.1 glycosyltransferase family 4 protein [Microcoleus sp. PH2017_19_SFW_U_A]MCC3512294.1 glycosyltransferase family 4 protein [Microcoleus sp. PH2017_17_BER_D_A]TAG56877.1 MAG: glycosyltransferase family 1 protein [Oscillatoriales cyanobacterium]MCC3413048.1 glycosyltransferase family 4 protein [Microcoleus sp. PH2017_02_FOX_O_A]MCC3438477.1 glycosyltransferase family 4 protein [Microcoleus sp. PH2017_05_C
MEKLKILVVNNLYPPQVVGGYERAIADYAKLLQERGHQVLVITSNTEHLPTGYTKADSDPPTVRRCLSLWGTWTERGAQPFYPAHVAAIAVQNYKTLEELLPFFQPDVCLTGNADFLGSPILEQILAAGIPIAHYVMNSQPGYSCDLAPQSSLYRYITVSDWIRENLQQQGYPTETAQTIYPGGDVEAFYQAELPPRDRLRIVYASLVMHYKGPDILIEALYLLHNADIDFTATIAGGSLNPSFVQELQEFVESEGLQDKIHFAGLLSRQELQQLYKTHNIWVLPSRFEEPFSIGLIEAMVAGQTIVTSNTGGSPEAVKHGETGLIFESENPMDLADQLSYLLMNPAEWQDMVSKGQERALLELSRTRTMDRLESVLYELALQNKK